MREPGMLRGMIDLKRPAQLPDSFQPLNLAAVDTIPDHFQINVNIAMNWIAKYFDFVQFLKHCFPPGLSAFILMVSRDNYNSRAVEVDGLLYNETKSKKTGKTG
ncbi:hypothetical protein HOLDEFILI_01196 [Holdemania filiformis DSM 12042]|uniref:Uncharacterized protein n=1 Tax=Holdemania filiformis DSM 12042 TaxID=545696 RepID=B9Y5W4_9FIRM|nr:hypothetical protein HOLDEFILI_01196 [Holdemania filiformis DSM 12042]